MINQHFARFTILPHSNGSTHFPEHRPTRLPTSTAANKRADFKASRRVAIEASLSPKSSVQHNECLEENGFLKPPNGLSCDYRTTTFSPLPSIIIDELSSEMQTRLSPSKTVDVSTGTADSDLSKLNAQRDMYKKDPIQRIYVGRSLRLEKIKFFGFDLDYTLCNYKSPAYETLLFDRTITRLIDIGYPESLKNLRYNKNFPVRGLWMDQMYGCLLKIDAFGNILMGVHGFRFLKPQEIESLYPNKFIHLNDSRIMVLNTLFDLPTAFLLASLIDYFVNNTDEFQIVTDRTAVRVKASDTVISFKSIGSDVEKSVTWIHTSGHMKRYVLENLDTYVIKDDRIKKLLPTLRSNGAQTFLLTNSEFFYTNGLLNYLIGSDWKNYFDVTIVDAKKPTWFADGTVFREVDTATGILKLGIHCGPLNGKVFAGGSCEQFRRLMEARGKDVLYVGDHIFGDVLRSKKSRGWRTFLVIPELEHELTIWTERHAIFESISELDVQLAKLYKNMDSSTLNNGTSLLEIQEAVKAIRNKTHEMDQSYGSLGSLFRSGSRTTFFASQVERYADLYASSPYNLLYYPGFYFFRAPMLLLPHELTVDHLTKIGKTDKKDNLARQASHPTFSSLIHEDDDIEPNSEEAELSDRPPSETGIIDEKNFSLKSKTTR